MGCAKCVANRVMCSKRDRSFGKWSSLIEKEETKFIEEEEKKGKGGKWGTV